MRVLRAELMLQSTDMSADIKGLVFDIGHCSNGSAMIHWTGTPDGTLRLQGSNDAWASNDKPTYDDLNWIDIDTGATGGASGSRLLEFSNKSYKYITLFYDQTASTGTITVQAGHFSGAQ